jgi:hypothetical protein
MTVEAAPQAREPMAGLKAPPRESQSLVPALCAGIDVLTEEA